MRMIRRRQPGLETGLILLALQVINFGIDNIPITTLLGVLAQSLLYAGVIKVKWNPEDVCISASRIIVNKKWRSLFLSNFEHGSDIHLYYNMVSFVIKGSSLEPIYGSLNFALLLGLFAVGCGSMYVCLGYALTKLTNNYFHYHVCAIGFSAILFALKVVLVCESEDRPTEVGGFRVPSKFSVWMELVLIHVLVPNSSLLGHLSGTLVGCVYCYTSIGDTIDDSLTKLSCQSINHANEFYDRRAIALF
ncbi:rhomboid-related protein 4-like [Trichogramma pretiosum]|uniref:rhomboid-related protein 4-like n=1 Tax=Trichogramma pretiosum TaxID=7493 RepID=UPI0006C9C2EB|nr:rhomboid-related protein 4-like [Trichogramma pretiosum]